MINLYPQIQYFSIMFSHVRDVCFDVTERKKTNIVSSTAISYFSDTTYEIGANLNVSDHQVCAVKNAYQIVIDTSIQTSK